MNSLKVTPSFSLANLKERLFSYVENLSFHTDEDCWNWNGYKTESGYGVVSINAVPYRVHRLSYWIYREYAQGNLLVASDKYILHKCDNRCCINPSHLYLGTAQQNADDIKMRGRRHDTKGAKNGASILDVAAVKRIRLLHSGGMNQREIGRAMRLDYKHVNLIVNRKIWKHV
jgi:hypothetical protein